MTISEYLNTLRTDKNGRKINIYFTAIYLLFTTMEFIKNDDGQIERIINFYRLENDDKYIFKEIKKDYKIKTPFLINYLLFLDLKESEKRKYINESKLIYKTTTPIKKNKESIIEYQKANETDLINRAILLLIDEIRQTQESAVKENEKYIKNLKNNETLLKAIDELKPRDKNLFLFKLRRSNGDFQIENRKHFLRWSKKKDKATIKRAIKYILMNDFDIGLSLMILDFDYYEQEQQIKWSKRLFIRDLYLRLFDEYLKETNGDKVKANDLTLKEINKRYGKDKKRGY